VDGVGQRLKEKRRRKGWSQRDLARETGVNADTISGIETGQHEPRPSTLRRLAEGLDIEVADFFQEPTHPKVSAAPPSPEWAETASEAEYDSWIKTAQAMALHKLWNELSDYAKDIENTGRRAHILGRTQKAIDQFFRLKPIEEIVDRRSREPIEREDHEGQETA
jgi:transcriptional regulator with XRE-family HTH domain